VPETPISPSPLPARKTVRQFNLRTLFLLTAAVAVWIGHAKNHYENVNLANQIEAMRPLARELMIDDPDQIAVVKCDEHWYDQNEWRVHLPTGSYRLCLATKEVDTGGLATINKSIPIESGTHELALEQKQAVDKSWFIIVTVDGAEVLRASEPTAWNTGHGSSGGGDFSRSTQIAPEKPVVLFRRRFMVKTVPSGYSIPMGPCDGLLLWIEPTASD
jgi:hypothetical protein